MRDQTDDVSRAGGKGGNQAHLVHRVLVQVLCDDSGRKSVNVSCQVPHGSRVSVRCKLAFNGDP
jgi:hypothetical protein